GTSSECMVRAPRNAESVEHDRASTVHEDAVLDVRAHRTRQHRDFEVTTSTAKVVDGVAMAHPDDVLVDDRAVVELRAHVSRGHPDEFHRTIVGLVVRPSSTERR